MKFNFLDIAIIFVWLTLTLGAGIVAGLRANFESFWAGGRSAPTLPLVFSVAATQVGAGAIAGIASATWSGGIGFGLVSLSSTVVGFLLVANYAPLLKRFGDSYGAFTLPQIFRVRYGRTTQVAAALVIIVTYLAILSAQFLATSGLLAMGSGLDLRVAIIFATAGVVFYSAFAGIRGDIATDLWHFAGMSIGLFAVLLPAVIISYSFFGWSQQVPDRIWNPLTFGGPAFLVVGLAAGGIVPMLMPELWAKVYASRSAKESRRVMTLAALAVIPFYLLAIYLGLAGSVMNRELRSPDDLVFAQMTELLPAGLLGVAFATFLSVVISSANSLMLVVSSAVLGDLMNEEAGSDPSLLRSRWLTAASGVAGAALAFAVPDLVRLLLGAFYMLLVLGAPLVGVLVWKRATRAGATWAIACGALITLVFLLIAPQIAFLPGFISSIIIFIVVSLLTRHADSEDPELALKLRKV